MKKPIHFTLYRTWHSHGWQVMAVTSVSGSSYPAKVFGRIGRDFDQITNVAVRNTKGKFATQEEAQAVFAEVNAVWNEAQEKLKALDRQSANVQQEREITIERIIDKCK